MPRTAPPADLRLPQHSQVGSHRPEEVDRPPVPCHQGRVVLHRDGEADASRGRWLRPASPNSCRTIDHKAKILSSVRHPQVVRDDSPEISPDHMCGGKMDRIKTS